MLILSSLRFSQPVWASNNQHFSYKSKVVVVRGEKTCSSEKQEYKVILSKLILIPYVVAKFAKLQPWFHYYKYDLVLHKLKTVNLKHTKSTQ